MFKETIGTALNSIFLNESCFKTIELNDMKAEVPFFISIKKLIKWGSYMLCNTGDILGKAVISIFHSKLHHVIEMHSESK